MTGAPPFFAAGASRRGGGSLPSVFIPAGRLPDPARGPDDDDQDEAHKPGRPSAGYRRQS